MGKTKLLVVLAIFALVLTSIGQELYSAEFTEPAHTQMLGYW